MTDVHAAIGLGQLAAFEKNQARRVRIACRYRRRLAGLHQFIELPQVPKNYTHAWHLYIVKLQLEHLSLDRDQFIVLLDKAGIEAGVHYKPLFEMSFYKQLGYQAQHFPNTVYTARRVVTLPLYPTLKTASVDYICDQIKQIVDRHSL
jgi:dTDP-4-amino-4,6-dideoxygalactose transaminase